MASQCAGVAASCRAHGIGMVFQHFSLFEDFTALEQHRHPARRPHRRATLRAEVEAKALNSASALNSTGPSTRSPPGSGSASKSCCADAGTAGADPRRAHLGSDPPMSRGAVCHARQAGGGRGGHPLHQPQARRGAPALLARHHPARRQAGGGNRSTPGLGGRTRRTDGGLRGCRIAPARVA